MQSKRAELVSKLRVLPTMVGTNNSFVENNFNITRESRPLLTLRSRLNFTSSSDLRLEAMFPKECQPPRKDNAYKRHTQRMQEDQYETKNF